MVDIAHDKLGLFKCIWRRQAHHHVPLALFSRETFHTRVGFSPFQPIFTLFPRWQSRGCGSGRLSKQSSMEVTKGWRSGASGRHTRRKPDEKVDCSAAAAHLVELGQLVDVGEGEVGVLQVVEAPVGRAGEDRGPPIRHRVVPVPSQAAEQLVRPGNCRQGWKHLRRAIWRRWNRWVSSAPRLTGCQQWES